MRGLLAIIAGIVAGFAAMIIIAYVGGMIFPATTRMDAITAEQVAAAFTSLPLGAKIAIIASWFGGALAGAGVAKKISGAGWAAWTVGGLFVLYVILTVMILPMPGWLQVAAVLAPLIGALLANHLVAARTAMASEEI
ncbi:MAG: hypothetical protein AB7O91_00025 [Sphingomonas sp.]